MASASFRRSESYENRFSTYVNWPPGIKQSPDILAGAGFRYMQQRDKVKCDTCGGKLYNWRENDDPVIEHMRYFPDCEFVKKLFQEERENGKGQQDNNVATKSPQETDPKPQSVQARKASSTSERSKVDKKWLRSQMDRPITQIVLSKGYPRRDIKKVIKEQFEETQSEFPDAMSLLKAIFELEEREERSRTFTHVALSSSDDTERDRRIETATSSEIQSTSGDNIAVKSAEALSSQKSDAQVDMAKPALPSEKDSVPVSRKGVSRNSKSCIICHEKEMGAMFLPCGHLSACTDCAVRVSECPTCHLAVQHRLRVYLS